MILKLMGRCAEMRSHGHGFWFTQGMRNPSPTDTEGQLCRAQYRSSSHLLAVLKALWLRYTGFCCRGCWREGLVTLEKVIVSEGNI